MFCCEWGCENYEQIDVFRMLLGSQDLIAVPHVIKNLEQVSTEQRVNAF